MPAAPDFTFIGDVEIQDAVGLPVLDAVAGSTLAVKFSVKNVGDLDASNVFSKLIAPGDNSELFPSETSIASLKEGETTMITLYWWATEVVHSVSIAVDPQQAYNDPNIDDNFYNFTFEVKERPSSQH